MNAWKYYYENLKELCDKGYVELPYVSLNSASVGRKFGRFHGEDKYTTKESERLVRLPMYYGLNERDCARVCESIKAFYEK